MFAHEPFLNTNSAGQQTPQFRATERNSLKKKYRINTLA